MVFDRPLEWRNEDDSKLCACKMLGDRIDAWFYVFSPHWKITILDNGAEIISKKRAATAAAFSNPFLGKLWSHFNSDAKNGHSPTFWIQFFSSRK